MENGPYGNIYIIILSIVGTIVIMIISAMYTIRNIKRVWCLGSVKKKRSANKEKSNEKKEQQDEANVGRSNNNCRERRKDAKRSPSNKEEEEEKEDCVATANSKNGSKPSSEDLFESNKAEEETPDPVQYYHHIPSEVKKARQRVAIRNIKSQLTKEELEREKAVQKQQLQEMFDLMKSQGDKFGLTDSEMEKQMQLYSI